MKRKRWRMVIIATLTILVVSIFAGSAAEKATVAEPLVPVAFDKNSNKGEYAFLDAALIFDLAQRTTTVNYYEIQTVDGSLCVAQISRIGHEMSKIYFSEADMIEKDPIRIVNQRENQPKSVTLYGYGKKVPNDVVNLFVSKNSGVDDGKFDSKADFHDALGSIMFVEGEPPTESDIFVIISALSFIALIPLMIIYLQIKVKLRKLREAYYLRLNK